MKQLREYINDILLERMHDASVSLDRDKRDDRFDNLTTTGKDIEPDDSTPSFMVDPLPDMQKWGGKYATGNDERATTSWEYVPNDKWPNSSEQDSIASWKANNPGKSDLDWGPGPLALDPSKDTTKYRFNRLTHKQEPVGDQPGASASASTDNKPATWRDIYQLNKKTIGSDPSKIEPGQLLKMPNGQPDYRVQRGDTLVKIASISSKPIGRPSFPHTPTPRDVKPVNKPTVTPTPRDVPPKKVTPSPSNIQPRITANTGVTFPIPQDLGFGKGEELITPALKAQKLAQDKWRAEYERKSAELTRRAELKKSMKEQGPEFMKHLRDYMLEAEAAPTPQGAQPFTPNQTMDPQQAAAANKAAQEFVAQLTDKVKTLAQTNADVLKTVTAQPVSAPQTTPVQEAQLDEGLFDGIVSWVKDALAKNPLIDIALRLIPSPAQAILAAIDVIDAVKSGRLADAGKVLAGMIPGGQQVAQAIGVGQAAASGDATSVATGLASAALPKIGETTELGRILAIARHHIQEAEAPQLTQEAWYDPTTWFDKSKGTTDQQARLKDMDAGQAKVAGSIDKFNQGDNVGGVMAGLGGVNDLANAAGMSFLDKLGTGWIAIKAGARAAWAGRKGNGDAAIVAALGSLGGEVSELFDDIVNEPGFAQKFQEGMLAMKDSTEPAEQEMYKKYMARELTAESFKAYINRFNTAMQNMKKNPETATLKYTVDNPDTPYVTPVENPTDPNANPMSQDPAQQAAAKVGESTELDRILAIARHQR